MPPLQAQRQVNSGGLPLERTPPPAERRHHCHFNRTSFWQDVVVGKSAAVLKLLATEDEALMVRQDTLLVLDLGLDGVDGVGAFSLDGDGFTVEGQNEDLHCYSVDDYNACRVALLSSTGGSDPACCPLRLVVFYACDAWRLMSCSTCVSGNFKIFLLFVFSSILEEGPGHSRHPAPIAAGGWAPSAATLRNRNTCIATCPKPPNRSRGMMDHR
jgi:hypothetical protein